ncbi:MAG: hypothetical protein L6R42_001842 [Xanthoria sp. 1 TBL-2021]|nr:MAG: hypothetical protein L6R42_001842 [Xanthoria sp. 1 TBL-2021]
MVGPSNGFKWFGEGFDGFPKILPDDCVQYTLYIVDADLSHLEVRAQLRKVQAAATTLCKDLLKDFIWQREGFCLELKQQDGLSFLHGRTNFGDSIEDEWLVVYLLRELSKKFPQSWIRVVDSDGEFLLVEAADALPKWLNPEVADNRVWISNGRLLIIPKERQKDNAHAGGLTVEDALTFIQKRKTDLLHVPAIESEAYYRMRKYPAQIQDSLHQGLITIPRKLAYVLHEKAAYISPAVEAFYLRDPIALRPLQTPGPSKLLFPPEDFMTVSTKFTKVGFAQLKGQDFETPRAWTTFIGKAPSILSQTGYQMGMKVTCGFEMLMSDPQNVDKKPVREINLLLEDLNAGEENLPSDQDVSKWESRNDDESWLDVNFEEFEKELSGKGDPIPNGKRAGFGDKTAQENLRRMVSMFEKFRDQDDDEVQDADYLDDMDNDNDSDSLDSPTSAQSEDEDDEKELDFDEDRFTSMMREMMGLPATGTTDSPLNGDSVPMSSAESDGGDEAKEIRKVMHEMEAELLDVGALSLAPPQHGKTSGEKSVPSLAASNGDAATSESSSLQEARQDQSSSDDDGELDIDFERAKELLSQFTVT